MPFLILLAFLSPMIAVTVFLIFGSPKTPTR
ncbi:hypothetical protein SUDANB140_00801 [Streptomyces sp. enrichment culture]